MGTEHDQTGLTLTDFLLARIAEDQVDGCPCRFVDEDRDVCDARWKAECEAKRRIVELHTGAVAMCQDGYRPGASHQEIEWAMLFNGRPTGYCDTLRAVALPYADHPDYQETWKP